MSLSPAMVVNDVLEKPVVKAKPRIWSVFATYLATSVAGTMGILAANVCVGVVIGAVDGAQGKDGAFIQTHVQEVLKLPLVGLLVTLLPYQIGMLLVTLLAAKLSPQKLTERLGIAKSTEAKESPRRLLLAGLAAFTVATALGSVILTTLAAGPMSESNAISNVIANGSWWAILATNFVVMLVPAFVEECLFRGYIQRRLLERWSPSVAISVTTLLFASLHCDSLHHIIAVVPLGLITGVLAYRTNSVRASIFVHAVHNLAAIGFGAYSSVVGFHLTEEVLGMSMIGIVASLFAAGLLSLVLFCRRSQQPKATDRDERRRESAEQQAQGTDPFVAKRPCFLQDSHSRRIGSVCNDRQPAACHRSGDQRVLEVVANALD